MAQAIERSVQFGKVRTRPSEKGGDLGAFEPDGRTFGVVLVVGVRGIRRVHDRVELACERREPIDCPLAFVRQPFFERHGATHTPNVSGNVARPADIVR